MLLPLCVFAQGKSAMYYYYKGCELLNAGKYEESVPYFRQCESLYQARFKPTTKKNNKTASKIAACQSALGVVAGLMGNPYEALRLTSSAADLLKKYCGEDIDAYITTMFMLARCYSDIGNNVEAIRIANDLLEIFDNQKSGEYKNSDTYAIVLQLLAVFQHEIGNYAEATRIGNLALNKLEQISERTDEAIDKGIVIKALCNVAIFSYDFGNYDEAISISNRALDMMESTGVQDNSTYVTMLYNLANIHYANRNLDEALRYAAKAVDIAERTLDKENLNYAMALNTLAHITFAKGNKDEAIRLGTLAAQITKKVTGENHPYYLTMIGNLSVYYFYTDKYDDAAECFAQTYGIATKYILNNFSLMTAKERSDFWKKNGDFIGKKLPLFAYKHPDSTLVSLAYDGQVFSKGILLNAELEIQNLIEHSGDTTFAKRFGKIRHNRALLDNLYQTPADKRLMDADSLAKATERDEIALVQSSKALGDYTKNLSISWRDIQKNLKDNDLAIEFASVKDTAAKQIVYVALVLKKGMTAPEIVKLYNSDDFYDIKPKEYYNTPKLYNLVWRPLAKYLEGAKTVYFSPAGQFHTIGIEYLPDADGKIFAEKFDTYRLSSTRELAMTRAINPNRKASTYGGIQYELSPDEWRKLKGNDDNYDPSNYRDIPQIAANLRGFGMGYLEGTKLESASIAALLRSANYDVTALSDAAATEESFKKLSGTGLKILHIGTHGFYETAADMQNAGYKFFSGNQQSEEDRSLSCSGLLFAGANSALDPNRNAEIPEGADDGVLTAKEISRLDFQGLDLVVLSACQTGLGEITGEGVFGLQRGFKKAGAQTIVMSLWKVADESTQLLMVEFFKNLTAGQSKRAAFLAAQKIVREKYPNPLHWAAFVMVDGL